MGLWACKGCMELRDVFGSGRVKNGMRDVALEMLVSFHDRVLTVTYKGFSPKS